MTRQFWLYMVEADEAALLATIADAAPGLITLPSKYLRNTTPEKLLAGDLAGAEFPTLGTRESHRILLHKEASKTVILHPILEGPLQGARSVDLSMTDCLYPVRPSPLRGNLEPAKLLGETHVMRAEKKLRKSPTFGTWLAAVHRKLKQAYPPTSVDFIHLAPGAREWNASGQGQLTYLYQPIKPDPVIPLTPIRTPQKR